MMGEMADYDLESEDPSDPLGTYWERRGPIEEDGYPFSDYYRRRLRRPSVFRPIESADEDLYD